MSADRQIERLDGWKEIARYSGKSVATARRWEDRGFPIRRTDTGTVFAFKEEVDAWFAAQPLSGRLDDTEAAEPRRRWGWGARVILAVAAVTVGASLYQAVTSWPWNNPAPAVVYLEDGRHWVVEDVAGKELWRKSWAEPLRHDLDTTGQVVDLDGDGRSEVLVVVAHAEPPDRVVAYSDTGAELWSYSPGSSLTLDGERYDDLYQVMNVTVVTDETGHPLVVVNAHHRLYFPAELILLDSTGQTLCSYLHAGWIVHMQPFDHDEDAGDELVFGAINNKLGQPVLGVLDIPFVDALSPGIGTAGGTWRSGRELAYLALPRTRTSALLSDHSWVERIVPGPSGELSVQVSVALAGTDTIIGEYTYDFGPGLRFERARYSDVFRAAQAKLHATGSLDFGMEQEVPLGPPEWLVGAPER